MSTPTPEEFLGMTDPDQLWEIPPSPIEALLEQIANDVRAIASQTVNPFERPITVYEAVSAEATAAEIARLTKFQGDPGPFKYPGDPVTIESVQSVRKLPNSAVHLTGTFDPASDLGTLTLPGTSEPVTDTVPLSEYDDLEAKAAVTFELIEEIRAIVKPSKSKIALDVKSAIERWANPIVPTDDDDDGDHRDRRLSEEIEQETEHVDPPQPQLNPEVEPAPVGARLPDPALPAQDATVEEWRAFAAAFAPHTDWSMSNRSQIRSAFGIPQPVELTEEHRAAFADAEQNQAAIADAEQRLASLTAEVQQVAATLPEQPSRSEMASDLIQTMTGADLPPAYLCRIDQHGTCTGRACGCTCHLTTGVQQLPTGVLGT